jgi:hypothetical protein
VSADKVTVTDTQLNSVMSQLNAVMCLQWESVEDKTSVFVYGAGAVTLLWLSSTLVGAINHVPVVRSSCPSALNLVGFKLTDLQAHNLVGSGAFTQGNSHSMLKLSANAGGHQMM